MHIFREKRIANGISYYMPTPVGRTGTCARPQVWRSQRSRAHTPPPPPNASPDADPQMHVWSVRYGRCACPKTSGKKVQPRHPSGCLVLNPRDPDRVVWQYPLSSFHCHHCPRLSTIAPIALSIHAHLIATLFPRRGVQSPDCRLNLGQ